MSGLNSLLTGYLTYLTTIFLIFLWLYDQIIEMKNKILAISIPYPDDHALIKSITSDKPA